MSIINLKSAYTAYKTLADRRSELESEIETLETEMGELVIQMSDSLPEGTNNFVADGRTLTPVRNGGKNGKAVFLRGYAPKTDKVRKVVEVLNLDSDNA